jgi:hypothetical protein
METASQEERKHMSGTAGEDLNWFWELHGVSALGCWCLLVFGSFV